MRIVTGDKADKHWSLHNVTASKRMLNINLISVYLIITRNYKNYYIFKQKSGYSSFWVVPGRLNFRCRRFGTICLFNLHWWCKQGSSCLHRLWIWNRPSVPKRRNIKFRRRGIPQKTTFRKRGKFEIKKYRDRLNFWCKINFSLGNLILS
jgi:hypothetical protein